MWNILQCGNFRAFYTKIKMAKYFFKGCAVNAHLVGLPCVYTLLRLHALYIKLTERMQCLSDCASIVHAYTRDSRRDSGELGK